MRHLLTGFLLVISTALFAQEPIEPIVNCVEYDEVLDEFTVHFGYFNPNDEAITIPLSKDNKLTPSPKDRGQPTVFEPGVHNNAFSTTFNGNDLTWHIESFNFKPKEATANAIDSECGVVSGIVTDARSGFPLVGVTVSVLGATASTTTGFDGAYTIDAPSGDDVLVYELEKYFTEQRAIDFSSQVDLTMIPDPAFLEPVFAFDEGDDLWPELFYLADQVENGETVESNDIFQIENGNVLIEVIANTNADINQLRGILLSLGFFDEVPNNTSYILTGYFPISNLKQLNNYDELINFVRPGYPPITNSGLVESQGDLSIQSNIIRGGFGVDGTGVKIGVLSDSYDAQGNVAAAIVANGDLPGSDKSGNLVPVEVLKDNPRGSNEGMGMLEIIHDVAPGSALGFRTGFLSSSDMALGIVELTDANYDVIVDDITYLSEPFTPTGQISQAVEYAASQGVHYLSSAGNFGGLGQAGAFQATSDIPNYPFLAEGDVAHQFASGDYLQQVSLEAGIYVIEMQWLDEFYSQGNPVGAAHDLDIWVVNQNGNLLYSGNRENRGEDPIEIVAFKINETTTVDILITGDNVPAGLQFQYVVLRGQGWSFDEHRQEASTVIGHASSPSLSSVGAVFYGFTPEYNEDATTWKANPTSSQGGSLLGQTNAKPDFLAADGANTSTFGSDVQFDEDNFPNFFGTSAAAPHAAGVLALTLQSLDKYYDTSQEAIKKEISTVGMRELVSSTALDLGDAGYDKINGNGLIRGKAVLGSLANPSPSDLEILNIPEGVVPGEDTFTLTLSGKYISEDTKLFIRDEQLVISNTQTLNDSVTVFETVIGPFIGNPALTLETPPLEGTNGSDGGQSDPVFLLTPSITTVTISVNDAFKKYGETLPDFTFSTDVELSEAEQALLPGLVYSTDAGLYSDIGVYAVSASFGVNGEGEPITAPDPLLEIYEFVFEDGPLFVDPLPVKITPTNQSITYGEKIPEITFNYEIGEGFNIPDPQQVIANIASTHQDQLVKDTIALTNRSLAIVNRSLAIVNESAWIISENALNRSLAIVNGNTAVIVDTTVLFSYENSPAGSIVNRSLAIVNTGLLANGEAFIQLTNENGDVIGNRSLAIVNRSLAIVNEEGNGESNSNTIMVVDEDDEEIGNFRSINYVTGVAATTAETPQYIIPGALYDRNFLIEYGVGELQVAKAELTLTANTAYTDELEPLPTFTYELSGFVNGETAEEVFGADVQVNYEISPTFNGAAGVYSIVPSIEEPDNYTVKVQNGVLYVNPAKGRRIRVWMECTEFIPNDPSGYQYRVYFSYENKNDVPWYIPEGENNRIVGIENYGGQLPEVFHPGVHIFSILFDGSNMFWELTSNGTNKSSQSSSESANSEGCSLSLGESISGDYTLAPNPTQDYVTVEFISGDVGSAEIMVFDFSGNMIYPSMITSTLDSSVTIDLLPYPEGTYYVYIEHNGNSSTLRVYKE